MSMSDFDTDLLLEFVAESLEHMEGIDQQLLQLEQNPEDTALIDGIFRAIHTIKGTSGFFQLDAINELSHRLENLLDQLRKGEKDVTPEIMDVLFQGCDQLTSLIMEVNEQLSHQIDVAVARDDEQLASIHENLNRLIDAPADQPSEAETPAQDSTRQAAGGYAVTPKLLQEFQVEANEHLESCDQSLVQLSEKPDDEEALNSVFRDMHSVKGTASYLGLTSISTLAHAAESMLELMRRREGVAVSDEELDLLFEALDMLKALVANPDAPADRAEELAERINRRKDMLEQGGAVSREAEQTRSATDPLQVFRDAMNQHLDVLNQCLEKREKDHVAVIGRTLKSISSSARYMGYEQIEKIVKVVEEALETAGSSGSPADMFYDLLKDSVAEIEAFLKNLSREEPKKETPPPAAKPAMSVARSKETSKKTTAPPVAAPKTMRVNQELVDTFMNLVGELIVARNAFGHIERRLEMGKQERAEALKELRSASLAVARISEEMQRTVMEMRMVPIRNVFQKFPRMVRDLSRKCGKKAQILLQGEETEIDKGIAEDLADPLVHIIRNSVDHGLESPEDRKAADKPEEGTIILRAAHEGNFIIIDIIDDGRGINTDAVLKKAIEKGLVSPEQAASLSHDEICGFIFKPGFSTAQQVTDISGRGVGMDVVMTNLKKLKGNVHVTSEPGQGTKVRLEVPLTLALVDALLVQVEDQTYALPLEAVSETVKVNTESLKSLMRKKAITLRGEVVSVADLADLLGVERAQELNSEELTLLIMKVGANRLGVIVDRIQRKEEIVVKPLADYLAAIPGLAGASILGDGRSILILEPSELLSLASGPAEMAA